MKRQNKATAAGVGGEQKKRKNYNSKREAEDSQMG